MPSNRSGQATLAIVAILFFVVMLLLFTLLGVPLNISSVVLIGALIFIISFVNTDLALIILIFSMLLSPEFSSGEVGGGRAIKIRADDIFIIIIFFGWIAKMAISKELGLLRSTRLNIPITAYVVICLLSSCIAIIEGRLHVKGSVFYLLKYIEYFLLFFMVANNLKTVAQAKKFIFYLLLTSFIVSIYALKSPVAGRISAPFESGGGGEPNTFAGYLVLMIPLILGFLFNAGKTRSKIMLMVLLGLSGIALLYTLSRSGWVSIFVVIVTFAILNKKHRIFMVAALVVTILLIPFIAPEQAYQRVKETFTPFRTYKIMGGTIAIDESGSARIDSWKIGLKLWAKRPILGYGIPAGFVIDNQYTRVLSETGVVGFAVFLTILVTIFRIAHGVYKTTEGDDFAQALSIGFLSGFMGLLVFSSAAAVFIIIRIMEPFWFVVAIITVLPELEKDPTGAELI